MTTSFSPFLYMVKSIPPSTAIAEYPSPSSLCQSRRGPVAGQVVARPFVSDVKLRCGPPHCGQSDDCAKAATSVIDNSTASMIALPPQKGTRSLLLMIRRWFLKTSRIDLSVYCCCFHRSCQRRKRLTIKSRAHLEWQRQPFD